VGYSQGTRKERNKPQIIKKTHWEDLNEEIPNIKRKESGGRTEKFKTKERSLKK